MFTVTLTDILWSQKRTDLPKECTFTVDNTAENTWREMYHNDFRANKSSLTRLLRDVFHVEAERKYGVSIDRCWIKTNIKI